MIRSARFLMIALAATAALTAFASAPARAQVPALQPPYNTPSVSVLPLASRFGVDGTVVGSQQTNTDKLGIVCRHKVVSTSGASSVQWGIQVYDAIAATYLEYASNTQTGAEGMIVIRAGSVASAVPTGTVVLGLPLPNAWRPFLRVVGGNTFGSRSQISCGYVK